MVAAMLKNKGKLLQRLCEEPVLYFEAYKLLGNEEEAEKLLEKSNWNIRSAIKKYNSCN